MREPTRAGPGSPTSSFEADVDVPIVGPWESDMDQDAADERITWEDEEYEDEDEEDSPMDTTTFDVDDPAQARSQRPLADDVMPLEKIWEVRNLPLGPGELSRFGRNGPPMNVMDYCPASDRIFIVNQRRISGFSVASLLARCSSTDADAAGVHAEQKESPAYRICRKAAQMRGLGAEEQWEAYAPDLGAQANRLRCGKLGKRPVVAAVDAEGGITILPSDGQMLCPLLELRNTSAHNGAPISTWGLALAPHFECDGASGSGSTCRGEVVVSANDHCVKAWTLGEAPGGGRGLMVQPAGFGRGAVSAAADSFEQRQTLSGRPQRPGPKVLVSDSNNIPCVDLAGGNVISASLDGRVCIVPLQAPVFRSRQRLTGGAPSPPPTPPTQFEQPHSLAEATAEASTAIAATEGMRPPTAATAAMAFRRPFPSTPQLEPHAGDTGMTDAGTGAEEGAAFSATTHDSQLGQGGGNTSDAVAALDAWPGPRWFQPRGHHAMWGALWVPLRSVKTMRHPGRSHKDAPTAKDGLAWRVGGVTLPGEIVCTSVLPFFAPAELLGKLLPVSIAHGDAAEREVRGGHRSEHLALCFSENKVWLLDNQLKVCCRRLLPFHGAFAHISFAPDLSLAVIAAKMSSTHPLWAIKLVRRHRCMRFRLTLHKVGPDLPIHWPTGMIIGVATAPDGRLFTLNSNNHFNCYRMALDAESDSEPVGG